MKVSKIMAGVSVGATNLYLASATFAQGIWGEFLPDEQAGMEGKTLPGIISEVLSWALGFAIVVAVIIIIAAGYMYITAAGDESKIKKATTTLTWAIIGLIIAFVAMILVKFVMKSFLGVTA